MTVFGAQMPKLGTTSVSNQELQIVVVMALTTYMA